MKENSVSIRGEKSYNKEWHCEYCNSTETKTRAKCGECETVFDTEAHHLKGIGGSMVKCPCCKNADIGWIEVCENCEEEK